MVAVPHDQEVAIGIHRHLGLLLMVGCGLIHKKFAPHRAPRGVVEPRIDVIIAGPLIPFPGDNKGAAGIHGDTG